MAKVAKKKTVDNGAAYEFCIKEKDVVKRVHFGSFEVIKTRMGIMFKNYTGFHVYTSPYAVGTDGVAHENSLYQWLDNLIQAHESLSDKLDEPFGDETMENGQPLLNRDIYDMQRITTEANCLFPLTAFIDVDHAVEQANNQIKWLTEQSEKLVEAMRAEAASEEEAVRADAEEGAKAINREIVAEMIQQEGMADA